MKIVKEILLTLLFICSLILLMERPAEAAGTILPTSSDNLCIGLKSTSNLVATNSGFMRVFYDGKKVRIEYYDDSFNIQGKKSIDMELSIWGGFYAGTDGYYLVEGQNNTNENDMAEVIRVIKYDSSWNKIGTARITGNTQLFGGEVGFPFHYGCVEMTEYKGTLYIVTGHRGYVDPAYNQGHQGFLMIAVDKASMTGKIVDADLWHSFAQYITCKDSSLYVLEQSEGSRYTELSQYDARTLKKTSIPVLRYGGSRTSAWAIACNASTDGMALSSDHVLCLGTSIDQSQYDSVSSDTAHNIYLTVTPMSNFTEEATTVKWLTNFSGGGKCFLGTKITKVNDDRFMISWEESEASQTPTTEDSLSASTLHYIFVDGKGNRISGEFTQAAPISECQPIVKGSKIVYYASNANMVNFYLIDAQTGEFSKKVYRVVGENAAWDLKEGVLTISGTGAMSLDTEDHYRYPVSSTAGGFSYTSGDNIWGMIKEKVKKIIIDEGITSIQESSFEHFGKLEEVEIKPGVKSIGKKAFYGCNALMKITIPSSVTSIGEDFLWTGYFWVSDYSHVVRATIYAPNNSYAMKYAQENGINYVDSEANTNTNTDTGSGTVSFLKAKISGIKTSYVYNGKAKKPEVQVKLGNKTLKKGIDYSVSYVNNKNTGKATVKIKGLNKYNGTITRTFNIVPKKAAISKLTSPKSKTIKVTWKKDMQAGGYQIQYAENSKFTKRTKSILIKKKSTVSKKISKLKKKTKYYVRLRAYKKIDGKNCYGAWSKTMKVKCK